MPQQRFARTTFGSLSEPDSFCLLRVAVFSDHDVLIIAPIGEIDLYTVPVLSTVLDRVVGRAVTTGAARAPLIVVDLQGVRFMSGAGLTVLLSASERMREVHGELRLAAPRRAVRVLLHAVGALRWFAMHDSVSEAQRDRASGM